MNNFAQTDINNLFSVGQIRLAQLSVYNWGSFNGLHNAEIDPYGTLVTGDNGAGKSTLTDGLMALLLPAGKAAFNVAAAQGDRTDRTLVSYMRGSYGSSHDGATTRVKSKREGTVVTGLRALYRGDDGREITLTAMFWMTQVSNALSDVKRVYAVARRDLSLQAMLRTFAKGNVRALKLMLKDDPLITVCDDNFGEYQEAYRRLLYMDNKNAPALLSRALGLKKIDDLTSLIRTLVLEPSSVKDDARKVVDEFTDLVGIHDQLLDAREQEQALFRLPDVARALREAEMELAKLNAEREGLPVYFGEQRAMLWAVKIEALQDKLDKIAWELKQIENQELETSQLVEQRHEDYLLAGGTRIEEIKSKLAHAQNRLSETTLKASAYQEIAKGLELDHRLEHMLVQQNIALSEDKLKNVASEKKQAQDHFVGQGIVYSNKQTEQKELQEEIQAIEKRPDSNIEAKYQRLRDEMTRVLGLDREHCLFIGELIDVREQEKPWQGAIERALGGLRTTLAVPYEDYPLVTRWLNQTHTGLHVRVQVVDKVSKYNTVAPEFMPDGYLRKLVWREHPYREWVKKHLSRFDLHCVPSTEELDKTPFSMTRQGLIHMDKGRFEKKDQHKVDDRLKWQIGFSNKSRLALLKQDAISLAQAVIQAKENVEQARKQMTVVDTRAAHWQKISEVQWQEIDVAYWERSKAELQQSLEQLEKSANQLHVTRKRWEEAKQKLIGIQQQKTQKSQLRGGVENEFESAIKQHRVALRLAEPGLDESIRELLKVRMGALSETDLERIVERENQVRKEIDHVIGRFIQQKQNAIKEAAGTMVAFRQKWVVIAGEWGADIPSLPEYLAHFKQLQEEGLPALVEKFKERLNKHTIQSIATIKQKIDAEREDISERIDTINRVLKRTEFRPGSHLRLGLKPVSYEHVKDFNRQLVNVLSQAASDDHEARFAQLQAVVEILDKASSPATSATLESLRLLDPRHQLSFFAEELNAHSGVIIDVLESSSGKSGGEKESFAGTIVAASLAYVLTPDGHDRPVYSTVFLDEAFSNTAEAVSRRVLRVFKELNIHVNLITPYKNINLARESARSLLIAERDSEQHESRLCEVTWEEIDKRQAALQQKKFSEQAENFGISFATV